MRSIRSRLITLLCLATSGLLLGAGLLVFFATRKILIDQFDEALIAKGRAIVTAAEIDDGKLEVEIALDEFAGFGDSGDYFEIRRENGNVEMSSPSLVDPAARTQEIGQIDLPNDFEYRIDRGMMADGRRVRYFVQRFIPRGGKKNRHLFTDLHLVVASQTAGLDRSIAGVAVVLIVTGVGSLFVTVPLVRISLTRGLKPLGILSRQVMAIGPDRLDQRVDEASMPAELLPVAQGLNIWLGRLNESFQRERRFSSHVAHELRTPLAELKMIAESGARWPEEATPERLGEMLEVIDELEGLLEKLLHLARADAGQQPLQLQNVDLEQLLDTVLGRFESKASERGIHLLKKVDGGPFISDPDLISAVLGNLIGNSVDYAPVGSTIEVRLTPERVVVKNPAPCLVPEDLPHLFDRFWRKDASRTGYGHSGLGLSIVGAYAALLGGSTEARITPAGELAVTVRWQAEDVQQAVNPSLANYPTI
jgi:signal transduction histidine kinase